MTAAGILLMLQGPHGSLFSRLGAVMTAEGWRVHRINLNGGDQADWTGKATHYRGRFGHWRAFLERFIQDHGVTDIILFGDCRPHHAVACDIARQHDIRVLVLEEGYIRPDFMTLEDGGVNGHSRLSRDPKWYRREARHLPPFPEACPIPSSFQRRVSDTMGYALATLVRRPFYPFYRTHRLASLSTEALGWTLQFLFKRIARRRSAAVWSKIKDTAYYVLPLQLSTDYQMRIHSDFPDMRSALDCVLESFARSAPDDVHLVIKRHPLDSGITGWARRVRIQAHRHGLDRRVHYMGEADIAALVAPARGVVTVNSTAGTLSLNAGVPTIVLGQAIYNLAGIAHQGGLDLFWSSPSPPDPELYDDFKRVLLDRCLVRGGYLSEEGIAILVEGLRKRLITTTAQAVSSC